MKQQITTLSDFPIPETGKSEKQIIVDVVMNPSALPDVIGFITPDLFSLDITRKIWEMILSMYNAGEHIDLVSVGMKGGRDFSEHIFIPVREPAGSDFSTIQHAKLFRDEAIRRATYLSACKLIEASTKAGATEEDMIEAISAISNGLQKPSGEDAISTYDLANMVGDNVELRAKLASEGKSMSIRTGFQTFDRILGGGFEPGQLIILAARPSVGKTSVMLQLARVAAEDTVPSVVFSIEMTDLQIGRRLILSTEYVTKDALNTGNIDWDAFNRAANMVSSWPITVNTKSAVVTDIIARIATECNKGRCKIAFIDYLGLMKGGTSTKDTTRAQQIGEYTKALKAAAKRYNIPIVLLCQLNRDMSKENREPQLTDLRDSGEIEQDADLVFMLDRDKGTMDEESQYLNIYLRKHRDGAANVVVRVASNETHTRFYETLNSY